MDAFLKQQAPDVEVTITDEYPPAHIYDRCVKEFGVDFKKGVVFTVGKTIHSAFDITKDLVVHELVHVRQQEDMGVDEWWDEYMKNPAFRFSQELEAYRIQYKWIWNHTKNKQERFYYLQNFAKFLAGPMYGSLLSFSEAMEQIKDFVS